MKHANYYRNLILFLCAFSRINVNLEAINPKSITLRTINRIRIRIEKRKARQSALKTALAERNERESMVLRRAV